MECQKCHTQNPDQKKFCRECGAELVWLCPKCKTEVLTIDKFCGECGQKLKLTTRTNGKSSIEIEGERKNVTVLFSDLSGYTAMSEILDPEEVKEIITRIFKEITDTTAIYGGVIDKYIGDAVLALFGVPEVHEDDPVRAVKAAIDIHVLVKTISPEFERRTGRPLRMHSGINTGLIVTGDVNIKDGSHGVVGDTLNLASRLCDIAGADEIVVSTQTLELITPYFETKALKKLTIKGITRPVTPHLIVGERSVRSRFEAAQRHGLVAFTGRNRELIALQSCLEKAAVGNGQFVTIVGEAGVGKSRLVYEFRHGIDQDRVTVLQGRCQPYGRNIPYLPFRNALKRGLHLAEDDTPAELRKKTISNVLDIDPTLEEYLCYYLYLQSIPSEDYPLPERLQGQELKNSINQALAAINILNSNRKPMMLVLEDWHWSDKASDSMLRHLVSLIGPHALMVLVIYRPEYTPDWPNWSFHTHCVLMPLDYRNTNHIIQSIWKVDNLPDGFAKLIHDRTGGNPFFVEEMCAALTEDGSVRITDQQALLMHSLEHLVLPATVQAVIKARLDRLDQRSRETLQLASVVGHEFTLRILEFISGAGDRISASLDVLKIQELIQQIRLVPEAEYMFKHVLTQVVVYEALLLTQRRKLHALVGQAIEELYSERLDEQAEKLAYHYSLSINSEKALYYLEMAGAKAIRVHSLDEARKYYDKALKIFDTGKMDPIHRQKYIDLTLSWTEVSQYAPSNKIREALKLALTYALEIGNRKRIAEVSYWVGRFAYMQGDFIEALPQIEKCIKWAEELKDRKLLGISYNLMGRSCMYIDQYSNGIDYLMQGINLIESFKKWDDIVYSRGILGLLLGLTGNFSDGITSIEKAIEIAKKYEIVTFEAMAFGYLGSIYYWHGHWNTAIDNCSTCIEKSKRLGNALPIIWAKIFKGAAMAESGKPDAGLALMRNGIQIMTATDSVLALRYFYSLFAESLTLNGDIQEAESVNQKALALKKSGQIWGEIISYRTLGIMAAAASTPDWSKVAINIEKSIELAKELEALPELVVSLCRYADLLDRKGDHERAHLYRREGRNRAKKIGCRRC